MKKRFRLFSVVLLLLTFASCVTESKKSNNTVSDLYDIINMFIVKGVKSETMKVVEIMDKSLDKDRYVLLTILNTFIQIVDLQTEHNRIVDELKKTIG